MPPRLCPQSSRQQRMEAKGQTSATPPPPPEGTSEPSAIIWPHGLSKAKKDLITQLRGGKALWTPIGRCQRSISYVIIMLFAAASKINSNINPENN